MILTERDQARFWAKVALPDGNGCMLWLAYVHPGGYGQFGIGGHRGRMRYAHRVSYVIAYGPVPDGLVVDHVKARGCQHRHCVAPLHLEAVTQLENVRRSNAGENQRVKSNCPQGHPYAGANLYVTPRGGRVCRICKNAAGRERYGRLKTA